MPLFFIVSHILTTLAYFLLNIISFILCLLFIPHLLCVFSIPYLLFFLIFFIFLLFVFFQFETASFYILFFSQFTPMNDCFYTLCDAVYILAPILVHLPQIYNNEILFSPLLSMITAIANILRIAHYAYEHFSFIIVVQSILVVLLHTVMISMHRSELHSIESFVFESPFMVKTNKKSLFLSYVQTVTTTLLLIYTMNFFCSTAMPFICSYTCMALETSVGIIQYVINRMNNKNQVKKRVASYVFVSWIVGDIGKIFFLSYKKAPMPYILVIVLQLCINTMLLHQK